MNTVRSAAVAGTFYPADAHTLSAHVNDLLNDASAKTSKIPKALIVPHAGYIYSGPIAANAFAQLKTAHHIFNRVVLLGPSHRVPVNGLALAGANTFTTPLGNIKIDKESVAMLRKLPQIQELPTAHLWEHSLEVQLPFLQTLLGHFTLVPIVVGDATTEEVAEVLECLWGNEETLILISSDLSHYLPYQAACTMDRATADAILKLQEPLDNHQACGCIAINGLLNVARKKNLQPHLLDLRNSGDTAGDKNRVVGYGAFGFYHATH